MVLSALALFCCTALPADVPATATPGPVLVASAEKPNDAPVRTAGGSDALPEAPAAKAEVLAAAESSSGEAFTPGSEPFRGPIKPAAAGSYETARKRKIWYGLMATGHAAAFMDAWTTRRAISGGYGTEGDPLMRPFANSGAVYAATQVSPAIMDFVGHKMMTSNHEMLRRFWWLPQAVGSSSSMFAAVHNYRLVN